MNTNKLLTIIPRVIVATDRVSTYACYIYPGVETGNANGGLDWTTGEASFGTADGLGGIPAQVGFDKGDGRNFYSHPDSQTDRIRSIDGVREYFQENYCFYLLSVLSDFYSQWSSYCNPFGNWDGGWRVLLSNFRRHHCS